MSLLSICQTISAEAGFGSLNSVVGNPEENAKQLLAITNREGKTLARKTPWQVLQAEHSFQTVADQAGYALPFDYGWHINDTVWDRSNIWDLRGPLTPQQWQAVKSRVSTGVQRHFRIRGNLFLVDPVPTTEQTLVYEYVSSYWALDTLGAAHICFMTDTDSAKLDEMLIEMGVKWRFLKAKGMDYAEEFRDYEEQLGLAASRDGARTILNFNTRRSLEPPLPNVPETGYGS